MKNRLLFFAALALSASSLTAKAAPETAEAANDQIVVSSLYGEIPVYMGVETFVDGYKRTVDADAPKKCRSGKAERISDYLVSYLTSDDGSLVPLRVTAQYACIG